MPQLQKLDEQLLLETSRDVYELAKQVGLLVVEFSYHKEMVVRCRSVLDGNNGAASVPEQIRVLQSKIEKLESALKNDRAGAITLRTEMIRAAATLLGGGVLIKMLGLWAP